MQNAIMRLIEVVPTTKIIKYFTGLYFPKRSSH